MISFFKTKAPKATPKPPVNVVTLKDIHDEFYGLTQKLIQKNLTKVPVPEQLSESELSANRTLTNIGFSRAKPIKDARSLDLEIAQAKRPTF